jgi:hypothetical protein
MLRAELLLNYARVELVRERGHIHENEYQQITPNLQQTQTHGNLQKHYPSIST